jgi:ribonuclease Z
MVLTVRFLGTSASRPTVERNVTSIAIQRGGETMLFDCGEGTQRQMMRYGISFNLGDIFFTHTHADHLLGIIGLVRTMALQGRTEPLRLYGPPKSERLIRQAITLGSDKQHFPISIVEMNPNEPVQRDGYAIVPYPVEHAGSIALGLALVESERLGRFNPELARELGIPEGPMWGKIHKGEPITLPDGRMILPSALVGPTRAGRKVVFTGDARPCAATIEIARHADLLIHEATFTRDENARAIETGHSTAFDAATVAREAEVKRLLLTHVSSRYARDAHELATEARDVFKEAKVARDGLELEIPFPDEVAEDVVEEAEA